MAKDPREYGFEGEMAMSQLKGIMQHAKQLHDMLKPETDLPEWVQKKLTLAYDYMQTAADYMSTEMSEEVQIDELSKDTMKSYSGKALNQYVNATLSPKYADHDSKEHNLAVRRMKGMNRADRKLAKEETELEEKYIVHMTKKGKPAGRIRISAMDQQNAEYHAKKLVGSKPYRGYELHKVVKEEVEDLDELSKSTLKSYLGKAGSGKQYSNPQHFRSSMLSQDTAKAKLGRKSKKDVKVMAKEEAPANAAGSGNIAGMGVGPDGEPGVTPAAMARYKRKNKQEEPKAGRKSFSIFMKGK